MNATRKAISQVFAHARPYMEQAYLARQKREKRIREDERLIQQLHERQRRAKNAKKKDRFGRRIQQAMARIMANKLVNS